MKVHLQLSPSPGLSPQPAAESRTRKEHAKGPPYDGHEVLAFVTMFLFFSWGKMCGPSLDPISQKIEPSLFNLFLITPK